MNACLGHLLSRLEQLIPVCQYLSDQHLYPQSALKDSTMLAVVASFSPLSSLTLILPLPYLVLFVLFLFSCYAYYIYYRLSHIPGPIFAAFTNVPRFYWVWTRRAHLTHIDLHERYGKLVRLGPNMVSVGDAAEIQNVYRMKAPFAKVSSALLCIAD